MTTIHVLAWLSLGVPVPAAIVITERAIGRTSAGLFVLYGALVYAALLVLPLHVEAALELTGLIDRVMLAGPAVVSTAAVLFLGRSDGGFQAQRLHAGLARVKRSFLRLPRLLRVSLSIVSLVYIFFALERLLGYPMEWDSVWYHLPMAASWLREGSLSVQSSAHLYEGMTWNADLFGLVAVATGWPALGEVWNVVSATLLFSSSYLLSRAIGAGKRGALIATLLVAGLPIVLFQTYSAYVDLFVAAELLAGLTLVSVLYTGDVGDEWGSAVFWGAGLALGLAVGTKPTAWPLAFLVAAAAVGWLFVRRPEFVTRRTRLLGGFGAALAAPAIFWVVRNGLATGNPFFPIEISFFGHQLFAGRILVGVTSEVETTRYSTRVWEWLAVPWIDGTASGYPYSPGDGLGPLFASLGLPGLLYSVWTLGRSNITPTVQPNRYRLRAGLLGFLLFSWIVWWFVHREVWRFGLTGLVAVCVLASPFLEDFSEKLPRLFGVVLLAAVLVFTAVATLPRAQSLAHRVHHGEWTWAEYYHLPDAYTRIPHDATVVNYDVARTEGWNNFALFGPELSRRVVPDWKARAALAEGRRPWECGFYVVDRRPFRVKSKPNQRAVAGLRLVADTVANHGDERWRIWQANQGNCTIP